MAKRMAPSAGGVDKRSGRQRASKTIAKSPQKDQQSPALTVYMRKELPLMKRG